MNPLDASFLHLEDGTNHLHVGCCAMFEGPPPPFEEIVADVTAKLPLLTRYRQRVRFVPLQLGRPVWVDDPTFDLDQHLYHVTLPSPGDDDQLTELVARIMEVELDRTRPLWANWIVDGLAGDRWALISKVHHCMVDGIAGVHLLDALLDHQPEPTPPPPDEWDPQPAPSDLRLVTDAVLGLATSPYEQYRAVRRLTGLRALARGGIRYAWQLRPTPATSLSGKIGPRRRWTWADAELADVSEVRHALGGTVNDVVLTVVAGGLRELLLSRGELVDELVVRSLIPVSVRAPGTDDDCHNYVSAVLAELPVAVADPVERLGAVRRQMGELKDSHEVEFGSALVDLAGAAPPPLVAFAERVAVRLVGVVPQHSVITVATNVPGPQYPLYALGRRMTAYYPYVPVAQGARVGVAILSYDGHLAFGITGDRESAPDIEIVAGAIEDGMAELLSEARRGRDSALATTKA